MSLVHDAPIQSYKLEKQVSGIKNIHYTVVAIPKVH